MQRRRKKGEWTDNGATHDTFKQFKKKKTPVVIRGTTNMPRSVM